MSVDELIPDEMKVIWNDYIKTLNENFGNWRNEKNEEVAHLLFRYHFRVSSFEPLSIRDACTNATASGIFAVMVVERCREKDQEP